MSPVTGMNALMGSSETTVFLGNGDVELEMVALPWGKLTKLTGKSMGFPGFPRKIHGFPIKWQYNHCIRKHTFAERWSLRKAGLQKANPTATR